MDHIFISYDREDADYARRLKNTLERYNFNVWLDDYIHAGTEWMETLEHHLDTCAALIVLMSPAARSSTWVKNELMRAQRLNKPVFPILLSDKPLLLVESIQYVDARDGSLPSDGFYNLLASAAPLRTQLPLLEWCDIPGGGVSLEYDGGRGVYVAPFRISKYPITNAQFEVFVAAADGYHDERWWDFSAACRRWRNQNAQPVSTAFPGDLLPRTNICWFEAMAFCAWLNTKLMPLPTASTDDWLVSLPTEHQWQRAAQGDDERVYPWGNVFDPACCNLDESGRRRPTPVDSHPLGASPFGVCDMTGNVWEWCRNVRTDGDLSLSGVARRAVRGGGWDSGRGSARLAARPLGGCDPAARANNLGIRLVRAAPFQMRDE